MQVKITWVKKQLLKWKKVEISRNLTEKKTLVDRKK